MAHLAFQQEEPNVVATGGNTANGALNNVQTGGNGINAYGYGNLGNNAVLTGGNFANGLGNNIGNWRQPDQFW